jgi:hypothetical protein
MEEQPQEEEIVQNLTPQEVPDTSSLVVIRLSDLLTDTEVLKQKELQDRQIVDALENPDFTHLRQKLIQWTAAGFPYAFPVFSISVTPPQVCSDGVVRNLCDYIAYVAGMSIETKLKKLEAKLEGIKVLNSYSDTAKTMTVHVAKA